jgi:hypothetical protein
MPCRRKFQVWVAVRTAKKVQNIDIKRFSGDNILKLPTIIRASGR